MARPREIDNVPEAFRFPAETDLDNGASPKAVWEQHNLGKWISLRTWQAHATKRRRAQRVERLAEQAAFFRQLLDALEVDRNGLSKIEEMQLGAALRGMLHGGKPTAVLRAVETANHVRRTRVKEEAGRIADEKHAAWRSEHERRERERIEAANRKADKLGRREGLSEDAIERIKQLYGLPGGAGDGSAAA